MKKLFKNSYLVLMSVLAFGFSACTEQIEYTPATVPATDQVYFSNTNSTEIELAKDAAEFSISVKRQEAGEALEIPVKFEGDSLAQVLCTAPEKIVFEKDSTTALYTITLTGLEEFIDRDGGSGYDKKFKMTLTIDDPEGKYTTPYGDATFAFNAFVPAPWSEWESKYTGTYTLSLFWTGAVPEVEVFYREHQLDETKAQFMFNMGTEDIDLFDMIVNYNKETGACAVEPIHCYDYPGYGPTYVSDLPNFPLDFKDLEETYENYPCTFDKETGLFTFNLVYFLYEGYGASINYAWGPGVEYMQLDGFVQYDYNFAFNYAGYYVDQKNQCNVVLSSTLGKDLSQVAMTLVKADADLNETYNKMLKDSTFVCDTLKNSGYIAYPVNESGNYVALAIAYDKDGEVLDTYTTEFEFYLPGQSSPWKSIGMATYTDDFITAMFEGLENLTYQVEVLENEETPGLYRVMNPYGAAYPYNEEGDYDTSKDYYFEIDATNPEAVYIPGVYETGMDWSYGMFEVSSTAYYYMYTQGYTLEELKGYGFCGTMVDGVITFPAKTLAVFMGDYGSIEANANGAFKLDLNPAAEEDEEVEEGEEAQQSAAARSMQQKKITKKELKKNTNNFKMNVRGKSFENLPGAIKYNF